MGVGEERADVESQSPHVGGRGQSMGVIDPAVRTIRVGARGRGGDVIGGFGDRRIECW